MSCSSEAPNDLSFVVYTNSREDYRVTVRSTRACMVGAERLVDEVARNCGEWLTNDFSALVGIVPSPDRPANWLGFRVFDAGQFMAVTMPEEVVVIPSVLAYCDIAASVIP